MMTLVHEVERVAASALVVHVAQVVRLDCTLVNNGLTPKHKSLGSVVWRSRDDRSRCSRLRG